MNICIKMWMKTCFHSHFYANFHASVTLLFLFRFSWNFHQSVELRNWEWYAPFWEVFAQFWIWKGQIFGSKLGLGKSLIFVHASILTRSWGRYKDLRANPDVFNISWGSLRRLIHLKIIFVHQLIEQNIRQNLSMALYFVYLFSHYVIGHFQ